MTVSTTALAAAVGFDRIAANLKSAYGNLVAFVGPNDIKKASDVLKGWQFVSVSSFLMDGHRKRIKKWCQEQGVAFYEDTGAPGVRTLENRILRIQDQLISAQRKDEPYVPDPNAPVVVVGSHGLKNRDYERMLSLNVEFFGALSSFDRLPAHTAMVFAQNSDQGQYRMLSRMLKDSRTTLRQIISPQQLMRDIYAFRQLVQDASAPALENQPVVDQEQVTVSVAPPLPSPVPAPVLVEEVSSEVVICDLPAVTETAVETISSKLPKIELYQRMMKLPSGRNSPVRDFIKAKFQFADLGKISAASERLAVQLEMETGRKTTANSVAATIYGMISAAKKAEPLNIEVPADVVESPADPVIEAVKAELDPSTPAPTAEDVVLRTEEIRLLEEEITKLNDRISNLEARLELATAQHEDMHAENEKLRNDLKRVSEAFRVLSEVSSRY